MMREFGLPHWRIRCKTTVLEPDVYAEVRIDPAREQACIEVDPAQVRDEESLVKTMEHELIHCVVAPFDAFADAAREWIPEGPARESARRVWNDAMERAVRNVERMAYSVRHAKSNAVDSGLDLISRHPHT
jgi:hypothetical protein